MRTAIICCIYKRPDLTRVVLEYYASLKDKLDLELIAVGSEGDSSRSLCERAGWNYVEHENHPLSHKVNRLFSEVRQYDVKGAIWINSDTLMSEPLIRYYTDNLTDKEEDVVGLSDLYFYSIPLDRSIHFRYRNCGEVIGTARYYSRNLLERIDYCPEGSQAIDRGVDSHSSRYLKKMGIKERFIHMRDCGGMCIDIKSDVVQTQFEMLFDHNCTDIKSEVIFGHFNGMLDKLRSLKPLMSDKILIPWMEIKKG